MSLIISIIFIVTPLIFVKYMFNTKVMQFYKLGIKNSFVKYFEQEDDICPSSWQFYKLIRFLVYRAYGFNKQTRISAKLAIKYLIFAKYEYAIKLLKKYPVSARTNYFIGGLYFNQKEYNKAIYYYNKALKIKPLFIDAIVEKGVCYYAIGNFETALKSLEKIFSDEFYFTIKAKFKFRRILNLINYENYKKTAARSYYFMSLIARFDGNLYEATEQCKLARDVFDYYDFLGERAYCYQNLGVIYRMSNSLDIAEEMFRYVWKIYTKEKLKVKEAKIHGQIGMICAARYDFLAARGWHQGYLQKSIEMNSVQDIASAYNLIGLTHHQEKKLDEAIYNFNEAMNINKNYENDIALAYNFENIARVYSDKKDEKQGLSYANKALKIYKQKNDYRGVSETSELIGNIHIEKEEYQKAIKILQDAIEVIDGKQFQGYISNLYSNLSVIYLNQNKLSDARAYILKSLEIEKDLDRAKAIAIDYYNLGIIDLKKNKPQDAIFNMERAIKYLEKHPENANFIERIKEEINNIN